MERKKDHDKVQRVGRWIALELFAITLVAIGAVFLDLAQGAESRRTAFIGWSGVAFCGLNLAWIVWFHLKAIRRALRGRPA